jgi:hypothetical protein
MDEQTKTCRKCKQTKLIADFRPCKKHRGGFTATCKQCEIVRNMAWRKSKAGKPVFRAGRSKAYQRRKLDPDYKRKQANNLLRWKYGMTIEEFDTLLKLQGQCCSICKSETPVGSRGGFCVDHCHDTKAIRGLLCGNCNMAIGHFRHDPELLRSAIAYLQSVPPIPSRFAGIRAELLASLDP